MDEKTDPGATGYMEFLVAPIPPDTVATVKSEIVPFTRQILEESGQAGLWDEGKIQVEVEKALSLEEELVVVGIQLLTTLAAKAFETLVLERWKERFELKRTKVGKEKKSGEKEGSRE